jgi:hypothetical protein
MLDIPFVALLVDEVAMGLLVGVVVKVGVVVVRAGLG